MKKTSISQQLSIYFVATTLCLVLISTSLGEGLIRTSYGYGYGYGYENNKPNDSNNENNSQTEEAIKNNDSQIEGAVSEKKKTKKEKAKKKKDLKISQKSVKRGEILVQSGKGFKKNSKLRLYFSKSDGTFYPPVTVKTNSEGKFSVRYLATKPAGTYKWYAVVPASGKKTKISSYKIVK
ncbi:MAG: hypothetical protein UR60_C0035G0003 [Candidatus Moranbacteria bacterium GW2011_GWF2_34_56]|nr:MAG: hypothetical protein UR51_C0007G0015 [Candidatus Moranbacteria bacterium GW2011_GWF1_34_10]KKP63912.1 MAG: hypothetical protein UR60_C0035G0003 [Candidatus Moranbacteria bacterium GW2011_GWF2_34_56]HBI16786.1 hypothetical protein [Candidatus Moranbacteria bacterium]